MATYFNYLMDNDKWAPAVVLEIPPFQQCTDEL